MKRILETEFNKKMVIQFVHLKKLSHHLLIENCLQDALWSAVSPAFITELLGKTLDQSTTEQDIDNNGVLVAFNNAAAAMQYLHTVTIAHRDIKPHNLWGLMSRCAWEVKLIDFDAAEELKEYLLSLFNFNFELDLAS